MKKMILAAAAAAVCCLCLGGCSGESADTQTPSGGAGAGISFASTTVTARVDAADGDSYTLTLGVLQERGFGGMGQMPGSGLTDLTGGTDTGSAAKPDGTPPDGMAQPAQGETPPDAGANGSAQRGEASGTAPDIKDFRSDMMSGSFFSAGDTQATLTIDSGTQIMRESAAEDTASGGDTAETAERSVTAAQSADITVGSVIEIEFGDDGDIKTITILDTSTGDNAVPETGKTRDSTTSGNSADSAA